MKRKLRVGTRSSQLAVTQTKLALAILQQHHPGVTIELVEIETKGDRLKNHSLQAIGGQGAFVKAIESALSQGTIDLAVHSLKDLPTELPADLTIGCVLERGNPADCLVFFNPSDTLQTLPKGAVVGTSSLRRQAQLLKIRPDLHIQPIRGNIDTRIRKLQTENYQAIVLAKAGIERLALPLSVEELSLESCLPAIGQGALVLECRQNDYQLKQILQSLEDLESRICTEAERAFLRKMDGSCTFPIGAYGQIIAGKIQLTGMVANLSGQKMLRAEAVGADPYLVGQAVAQKLLAQGAQELIRECQIND